MKAWTKLGAQVVVPPTVDPIQKVACSLLIFKGSTPIELVAPVDRNDNPVKNRLAQGGGLDHICLFSDDVASDLATFVADGASIAVAPCYGVAFDREIAFAVTRVGLVVEFMSKLRVGLSEHDPLAAAVHLW